MRVIRTIDDLTKDEIVKAVDTAKEAMNKPQRADDAGLTLVVDPVAYVMTACKWNCALMLDDQSVFRETLLAAYHDIAKGNFRTE